jgi:hypothetical protein
MITLIHLDFSDCLLKMGKREIIVHRYEGFYALGIHLEYVRDAEKKVSERPLTVFLCAE